MKVQIFQESWEKSGEIRKIGYWRSFFCWFSQTLLAQAVPCLASLAGPAGRAMAPFSHFSAPFHIFLTFCLFLGVFVCFWVFWRSEKVGEGLRKSEKVRESVRKKVTEGGESLRKSRKVWESVKKKVGEGWRKWPGPLRTSWEAS